MSTSGGYTLELDALRERAVNVSRSHARHALLALTVACIVALTALKATGTESHVASDALAGILAVAFIALALVDFRASVAVAIFELVLLGAGGRWIDYGGGLTGRIFLDSVVTLRAAWLTIAAWRRQLSSGAQGFDPNRPGRPPRTSSRNSGACRHTGNAYRRSDCRGITWTGQCARSVFSTSPRRDSARQDGCQQPY